MSVLPLGPVRCQRLKQLKCQREGNLSACILSCPICNTTLSSLRWMLEGTRDRYLYGEMGPNSEFKNHKDVCLYNILHLPNNFLTFLPVRQATGRYYISFNRVSCHVGRNPECWIKNMSAIHLQIHLLYPILILSAQKPDIKPVWKALHQMYLI